MRIVDALRARSRTGAVVCLGWGIGGRHIHGGSKLWDLRTGDIIATFEGKIIPSPPLCPRRTFTVKITPAGNESFESWRERDHDDLVLAVALAAWAAETLDWPPLEAVPQPTRYRA